MSLLKLTLVALRALEAVRADKDMMASLMCGRCGGNSALFDTRNVRINVSQSSIAVTTLQGAAGMFDGNPRLYGSPGTRCPSMRRRTSSSPRYNSTRLEMGCLGCDVGDGEDSHNRIHAAKPPSYATQ